MEEVGMRAFGLFVIGALVSACGGTTIAPMVMRGGDAAPPEQVDREDPAFGRQLAGHLRRVEGCFEGAQARRATASGLVEVTFTIEPSGHVAEVAVERDTSGDAELAACIRSRLAGIYFDPAPAEPLHRRHHFAFCGIDDAALCALGPPAPIDAAPAAHQPAVEDLFRARSAEIVACQASTDSDAAAIVEVEVTVGVDGRVMAGRITDTVPSASPVARCALRPLLGTLVTEEPPSAPANYRRTLLLRPTEAPTTAALAP